MACPIPAGANDSLASTHYSYNRTFYTDALEHQPLDVNALFQDFILRDDHGQDITRCGFWPNFCQQPFELFASPPLLAVCASFANITQQIVEGQTDSNWTQANFVPEANATVRATQNLIPSCLIGYCALIPGCSSKMSCLVNDLFTSNGTLSGQGIASCWRDICDNFAPYVDKDFGGIGV